MSRRKQEKPQPRKNLIKGDPDCVLLPDILTCGSCQKRFPLGEIVRFIQHKVQLCNKENNSLRSTPPFPYEEEEEEDSDEDNASSLLVPKEEQAERCRVKEEPVSSSSAVKATKDVTAADTRPHEPRHYVCSTCKQSLSTAWALIQHVQSAHGLSICVDSTTPTSDDNKSTENCPAAEQPAPLVPYGLRAPLLERQMEPLPLFAPRIPSSQELRLDLIGKSSSGGSNGPVMPCVTPPPLLEPPKISNFQDSSYSQRLRVLAGATSPNASSTTPRKLLQSNFKALLNNTTKSTHGSPPRSGSPPELSSSLSPPQSSEPRVPNNNNNHSSSASSTTSDLPPQSTSPPKNRLCEYCGKSFQFKSNLIVHRRSHTGEKPFKCHICNHACTQASKLKRHMKTHRTKGGKPQSQSAVKASSGRPQTQAAKEGEETGGKVNGECGSDDREDEDMDEEEVDDEEEEEEEEEINVDVLEEEEDCCLRENGNLVIVDPPTPDEDNMVAEDLTQKKKPSLNNGTTENGTTHNSKKKDREDLDESNKRLAKHSVISEIMEKIGFGCIPPYNEAYKQALKESSYRNSSLKHERCSSGTEASNDAGSHHSYDVLSAFHPDRPAREGTRSAGQSPLGFGLDAFDSQSTTVNNHLKRIRLEESSAKDKDGNFLYAGVWFPRVEPPQYRDLYGLEGKSTSESALTVQGGRPGPSANAKPKEGGGGPRRNDTCEFCGKVFKNCSNLTVHRRSHTGEKPYKCELCSYACAQSSKLTRHMKTHGRLGKDVYRCRFCDMPFSVASTLEKHMRKCVVSQSGGSPYLVSEDSKEMTA